MSGQKTIAASMSDAELADNTGSALWQMELGGIAGGPSVAVSHKKEPAGGYSTDQLLVRPRRCSTRGNQMSSDPLPDPA